MGGTMSYQNSYKEYEAAFSYSDVLLELQTLSDIRQGYKIILNPKDKSKNAEKLAHQPTFILGFLGRENNIKANLINKICGYPPLNQNIQDLDQFKGIKTRFSTLKVLNDLRQEKDKGIKPHHKVLTCFSSTNTEYPVFFHNDEAIFKFFSKCQEIGHVLSDGRSVNKLDKQKYENLRMSMMNDKYITESFIENFIMEVSDMILIVVNEINFDDQNFIERVCLEYKQKKKILVLHYFENLQNSLQIKTFVDKEIRNCFLVKDHQNDLKKFYPTITDKKAEKLNRSMYIGESINEPSSFLNPDDRPCVIHLIYAKEGTKMGKFFNTTTLDYIHYLIKKNLGIFKEFKLAESMKSFFENNYLNYFQINRKNEKNPLEIDVLEEIQFNNRFIKPNINYDIKYLTDPKYDVMGGIINVNSMNFTPPYNVIEHKNTFDVVIECPLLKKDTLKVMVDRNDPSSQYLMVTGEKRSNAEVEKEIDNAILETRGNLEYGRFLLKIAIAPHTIRLKKKKDVVFKKGIIVVKLFKGEDDDQQMLNEDFTSPEIKFSNINLEERV